MSWTVPQMVTDDARIRLRFGDGTREQQFDFSAAFSLRPSPWGSLLEPNVEDIGRSPFRGESEDIAWVEGSPEGTGLRIAVPPPCGGLASGARWESEAPRPELVDGQETSLRPSTEARLFPPVPDAVRASLFRHPPSAPLLTLLSRLNL